MFPLLMLDIVSEALGPSCRNLAVLDCLSGRRLGYSYVSST
jgi:hypothetical protein